MRYYRVRLRFQYPGWDEVNGIPFVVYAATPRDAIARARRQADRAGHLCGGSGRVSFKCEGECEAPAEMESY